MTKKTSIELKKEIEEIKLESLKLEEKSSNQKTAMVGAIIIGSLGTIGVFFGSSGLLMFGGFMIFMAYLSLIFISTRGH